MANSNVETHIIPYNLRWSRALFLRGAFTIDDVWMSKLKLRVRVSLRAKSTRLLSYFTIYQDCQDSYQRSGFSPGTPASFPDKNWTPWYSWNIAESGIKHHQTNKQSSKLFHTMTLNKAEIKLRYLLTRFVMKKT